MQKRRSAKAGMAETNDCSYGAPQKEALYLISDSNVPVDVAVNGDDEHRVEYGSSSVDCSKCPVRSKMRVSKPEEDQFYHDVCKCLGSMLNKDLRDRSYYEPQGPPMEFPPLDGLKLWHLLQTHVSADCGASLKVNFEGNVHPPQHMQDIHVYNEDQRLKMNPQILQNHHQHEKLACSCPMCPMQEKKNPQNMKPMEPPHPLHVPINPPQVLHQPNHNQNGAMKPPAPPPSTNASLNCSVCHKKIRNSKKQQQAAARNPNYCPICDKCSRSHKDLYNQNNIHGSNSSHAHNNNAQNQNSSVYSHNSHNSMNHHSDYNGQFSSQSVKDSHLSAHSCKVCKKGFVFKHDLDRHTKASRGECGKQFKCSKCDKYFSNGGNLKRHLMIHTGEKPYTCHVCNKPFRTKTLLSNHIRTHTGEKPFLCHLCDKKFSKAENLKRHVKIHVKHTLG